MDSEVILTKEQMEKYLNDNWNVCFMTAMSKCLKDILCKDCDESDMNEYRAELKQLVWEAISQGVKDYLEEYQHAAAKIVAEEFMQEFCRRKTAIVFEGINYGGKE